MEKAIILIRFIRYANLLYLRFFQLVQSVSARYSKRVFLSVFMSTLRIATRKSPLALWQAEHVAQQLKQHYPELTVELVPIVTQGDILAHTPLSKIGGKNLFIKELEIAMQQNAADIAVHSMKDVGVTLPEGFVLAAILPRENPFDALVSNHYAHLNELPNGARVGTCSLRRKMQLAHYRPDLKLIDIRGNVHTRLQKLDSGAFDALILACAGLIRLQQNARIRQILPAEISLPAIGQGAIGVECRADSPFLAHIQTLNHFETAVCVQTERVVNQRLQGDCQVPIAAFATLSGKTMTLQSRIGTIDGRRMLAHQEICALEDAEKAGARCAEALIQQGAQDILHEYRK